jgi:histidinol-phosphate/aromatic aminotransferase/cobyric acid decarboxylase-like protein
MRFPLADWIDAHAEECPHHLSRSGMVGTLRSTPRLLRRPEAGSVGEVQRRIGKLFDVPPSRIVLTHGATEANAAVLLFKFRRHRLESSRAPVVRLPVPEYPPLRDAARLLGYREAPERERADLTVFSEPGNPIGVPRGERELAELIGDSPAVLVDTTFREFTLRAPVPESAAPEVWRTGTFTKAYGADSIRVGYVVVPEPHGAEFGALHGLLYDEISERSIDAATTLLRHRAEILRETREVFQANVRALRNAVSRVPSLAAPVWFDRGNDGFDGDALAELALREGVLVCPGSYFGDSHGVRICLTQRSFPEDLRAYLEVRELFTRGT